MMNGLTPVIKLPPFRLTPNLAAALAFVVAGFLSLLIAWAAVLLVERLSERAVRSALLTQGVTFVTVNADGLRMQLTGTADNEAQRYRAINIAGAVIDATRIQDLMEVTPARAVEAPRFSLEMLRNDDGIQLIGLLPEGETKEALLAEAEALQPDTQLQDMLETAAYEPPETWGPALEFAARRWRFCRDQKSRSTRRRCGSPRLRPQTSKSAVSRQASPRASPRACVSASRSPRHVR